MALAYSWGEMKYLAITLFSLYLLSGCSIISNKIGVYKVSGGVVTKDREEGSPWVELTYNGKEDEQTIEVLKKWKKEAKKECNNRNYDVRQISIVSQLLTPGGNEYFDRITVNYPESNNKKWPQVVALIKC